MDRVSCKGLSNRLERLLARLVSAEELEGVLELTRYLLWLNAGRGDAAEALDALSGVPVDRKKQAAADRRLKRFLFFRIMPQR